MKMFAAILTALLLAAPALVAEDKDGDGWKTIFDGKSMDGWKINESKEAPDECAEADAGDGGHLRLAQDRPRSDKAERHIHNCHNNDSNLWRNILCPVNAG